MSARDTTALERAGPSPYLPASATPPFTPDARMLTAEEQEAQRALLDAAAERVGSLAELARRLGRDIRTTRRWRSGESPVPDVVRDQLQQIADGGTLARRLPNRDAIRRFEEAMTEGFAALGGHVSDLARKLEAQLQELQEMARRQSGHAPEEDDDADE